MTQNEKLQELRKLLVDKELGGYLVPRTDEYQGEYVPACAERLAWLTGFSGSAGLCIVGLEKAVVMSDGRYTIQLAQQVDGALYERENSQEISPDDWLKENMLDVVIGYDPKLHTPKDIEEKAKEGLQLKAVEENLIDLIWQDRPEPPCEKINLFDEKYAGQSAAEKINHIQCALENEKADGVILTLSDSIAWLLNVRGHDIPFIPVVLSYAIVPVSGKVQWFVHPDKVTKEVADALDDIVSFHAEEELEASLESLQGQTIWLDPKRSSIWFQDKLEKGGAAVIQKDDPCIMPRACKNEKEQQAMRAAHIRDGVALVKFLKWFSTTNEGQTELSVEEKLQSYRAQAPEFKEPSFSTIAGFGENGAIVHYRATPESSKTITRDNLLLLDSGAQYIDGTTDITRTIAVGTPSDEMKKHNTLVLKGHISLARALFDEGTTGKEIDVLARGPLQAEGLNYAHGTGHGVGCYLSVHEEAAKGISPRADAPLKEGMILSNEPGYYKEGAYGIRIENLVLVKRAGEGRLCFETMTLAPIDKKLIVPEMLNAEEKDWLNEYHARVYETLSPLLDQEHQDWLKQATHAL